MSEILRGHFRVAATEAALEPPTTLNELHVRAHVCFASVAPHRTDWLRINDGRRNLINWYSSERHNVEGKRHVALLEHVRRTRYGVHCRPEEARTAHTLILNSELCGDEWRYDRFETRLKDTATILDIIFGNLNRAGYLVRVQSALLLRLSDRCGPASHWHGWLRKASRCTRPGWVASNLWHTRTGWRRGCARLIHSLVLLHHGLLTRHRWHVLPWSANTRLLSVRSRGIHGRGRGYSSHRRWAHTPLLYTRLTSHWRRRSRLPRPRRTTGWTTHPRWWWLIAAHHGRRLLLLD